MSCIPDNLDLFERHDAEQERKLKELPQCCCCDWYIQQEEAVYVDGKWYCEECEDEAWKKIRKDYLESTEK